MGEGLQANLKYHPSIPIPILSNYLATELFAVIEVVARPGHALFAGTHGSDFSRSW